MYYFAVFHVDQIKKKKIVKSGVQHAMRIPFLSCVKTTCTIPV